MTGQLASSASTLHSLDPENDFLGDPRPLLNSFDTKNILVKAWEMERQCSRMGSLDAAVRTSTPGSMYPMSMGQAVADRLVLGPECLVAG